MTAIVVLDPGSRFAELSRSFANSGWQVVDLAAEPILPDEPEFAVFEVDDLRLVYTFNPICQLRILDCTAVGDTERLPEVPRVDTETVRQWLAAADERTVLRGVLAGGQLEDATLVEPIRAHLQHPRGTIAAAAARVAAKLGNRASGLRPPPESDREVLAQAQALVAIDVLEQQLTPLLYALAQEGAGEIVKMLQPASEDYALTFKPVAVEPARAAYEELWARPLRLQTATQGSRVDCHIAPAGMLSQSNELSRHFPGGYRAVASLLQPDRVWVAWKVVEPGQTAGTAYDGLVWLTDRWVWFPKPYRVLRSLLDPPGDDDVTIDP